MLNARYLFMVLMLFRMKLFTDYFDKKIDIDGS